MMEPANQATLTAEVDKLIASYPWIKEPLMRIKGMISRIQIKDVAAGPDNDTKSEKRHMHEMQELVDKAQLLEEENFELRDENSAMAIHISELNAAKRVMENRQIELLREKIGLLEKLRDIVEKTEKQNSGGKKRLDEQQWRSDDHLHD